MARLEQMVDIMSSFEPKEHMSLAPHDLNTIITDRVDRRRTSAGASGVTFEVDLDTRGCPSRINADSLGRVIDRIIDNALEASSKGQAIQIRSRRGGDHCEIEIQDEGPGVKPEDLSKVFKPFFYNQGEEGRAILISKSEDCPRNERRNPSKQRLWARSDFHRHHPAPRLCNIHKGAPALTPLLHQLW